MNMITKFGLMVFVMGAIAVFTIDNDTYRNTVATVIMLIGAVIFLIPYSNNEEE